MSTPTRPTAVTPDSIAYTTPRARAITSTPMNTPIRPINTAPPLLRSLSHDLNDKTAERQRLQYLFEKLSAPRSTSEVSRDRRHSVATTTPAQDGLNKGTPTHAPLSATRESMPPLPKPLFGPIDFSRSAAIEHDQDVNMADRLPADLSSILTQQRNNHRKPIAAEDVEMDIMTDQDAIPSPVQTHSFAIPALPSSSTGATPIVSSTMAEPTRPRRATSAASNADTVFGSFGSDSESYRFSAWDIASWNKRLSKVLEDSQRNFRPLAETMGPPAEAVRGNGLGLVEAATTRVRARDVSPVKKANARGASRLEEDGRALKRRIVGRKMSIGAEDEDARPQGWVYDATVSAVDVEAERSRKRSISSSPFTYGEQGPGVSDSVPSTVKVAQADKAMKNGSELIGMGLGDAPLSAERGRAGLDTRMRRPTPPSKVFTAKPVRPLQ
ncbi:uncharacterized protein STEHIDRAFT_156772 [Stereum hirsutum FP-91666 SS1]|uniref:uncharacterized protein n=1 Tax=Stereum hirsutum (strain FP-91666) TaxID=721885 RepID=UPI000440B17B|nr:uncharacterized protein STEHIDRAFT_156772 [Stereum hirsutum FP-91666 SS1]EIM86465.1 hypothetical protein STEHIDRAFT_156772 [Stereum hirsutum FP-91666 SS1]